MPTSEDRVTTVCVISHSGLATGYVVQILSAADNIRVISLDEIIRNPHDASSTVFLFDASSLKLPLGECLRRLRHHFVKSRFIVVDQGSNAEELVHLLQLGVHGYIEGGEVTQSLLEAVNVVRDGALWVAPKILQYYVTRMADGTRRKGISRVHELTQRERQVLELVRQRYSNQEIATMLGVNESTVKFHLTHLFEKLGVVGRQELIGKNDHSDTWDRLLVS